MSTRERTGSEGVDCTGLEPRKNTIRCPVCERWVELLLVTERGLVCQRCRTGRR